MCPEPWAGGPGACTRRGCLRDCAGGACTRRVCLRKCVGGVGACIRRGCLWDCVGGVGGVAREVRRREMFPRCACRAWPLGCTQLRVGGFPRCTRRAWPQAVCKPSRRRVFPAVRAELGRKQLANLRVGGKPRLARRAWPPGCAQLRMGGFSTLCAQSLAACGLQTFAWAGLPALRSELGLQGQLQCDEQATALPVPGGHAVIAAV